MHRPPQQSERGASGLPRSLEIRLTAAPGAQAANLAKAIAADMAALAAAALGAIDCQDEDVRPRRRAARAAALLGAPALHRG
jgi:hypothetical protein